MRFSRSLADALLVLQSTRQREVTAEVLQALARAALPRMEYFTGGQSEPSCLAGGRGVDLGNAG